MKSVIAFISIAAVLTSTAFAKTYTEDFNWSGGETASKLEVVNANGDLIVKGGGDAISIKAVKKAPSKEYLEDLKVIVTEKGKKVKIEVDYPSNKSSKGKTYNKGGRVDLDVTIPSNVALDVELANGDVTAENISRVDIGLANGEVNAKGIYKSAEIDLANGTVYINNPDKASENIEAGVANGDIEATFMLPNSGGDFDFNAVNGKITINLRGDNDNFDFDASTVTGSVKADFPLKSDKGWVGGDYSAKVGDGTNDISAEVVTGTVEINIVK